MSATTYGARLVGDATPLGTIERKSLTAYFIAGAWVPFTRLDVLVPAEPLVAFTGCPGCAFCSVVTP